MKKNRILIIGTFLYDNSTPFPQAKLLGDYLESEGYNTICVSTHKNKLLRLVDICASVLLRKYDFLFVQIFSGPAFIYAGMAILLGKMRGKKVVGVLRGGNLPKYLIQNLNFKSWLLTRCNVLISPSGYLKDALAKLGITTEIIPNIVDLGKYTYKSRKRVSAKILWIRRYIDIYNPKMVVNVARRLKIQYPDFQLTMAGGGDYQALKEQAIHDGLGENMTFYSFVSKEKINELGQLHDIFINTANIDNFPVTVVEAMAMGLVVVSTNVGGIPFILDNNINAILVNPNDDEQMAAKIIDLCEKPVLTEKICEASHATVLGYSWENIREKYIAIFS